MVVIVFGKLPQSIEATYCITIYMEKKLTHASRMPGISERKKGYGTTNCRNLLKTVKTRFSTPWTYFSIIRNERDFPLEVSANF